MSSRLVVPAVGVAWVGATLLLSELRWFARPGLVERLRPYVRGGGSRARVDAFSAESLVSLVAPAAGSLGSAVARLLGIDEDLGLRLTRVHEQLDVTGFRLRQVGWAVAGLGVAGVAAVGLAAPAPLATVVLLGGAVVGFLLPEHSLARRSAAWQRRVFLELPVVAEQLAMLLRAGSSLQPALARVARRGSGAVASDLGRVVERTGQGVATHVALREWSAVAGVPVLDRFVGVLALDRETSDLGRLLADEARSIRRDVHRELVERVERRNQQVWIPVTVAALVPGVLFLAIPFIEALRLFGG